MGRIDLVKRVFKLYFDFEKEEIWLNEMAQQGWMMKSFFMGFYQFVQEIPGEYIYRIEMLPHIVRSPKNQPYLHFLQDLDVEIMSAWLVWVFYRRKAVNGPFDVYSDMDLRIKHYKRISRFLLPLGLIELLIAIYQGYLLFTDLINSNNEIAVLPTVFVLLFASFFAFVILNTARRSRKKSRRLIKEKQLHETLR